MDFLSPVFWLFLTLTGVALVVLRRSRPDVARPYRVPLFPFTPLAFAAGSAAVSALMVSPLAKGLFARAIGESGGFFDAPARKLERRVMAEQAGLAFARKLGAATAADMRSVAAGELLAAQTGAWFRPILDGYFLPQSPADIFSAREQSDVALLAGWNKDEGFNLGLAPAPGQSYEDTVRATFGAAADELLQMYPPGDAAQNSASARALGGDSRIVHATWAWIEAQKSFGTADIFRFRFERAPLTPEGWFGDKSSREAGAFHSGELLYVFDTLDAMNWLLDDADREIARFTTGWWLNFIKTGNPNGAGLPEWPSYRSASAPVMHIDAMPEVRPADDGLLRRAVKFARG